MCRTPLLRVGGATQDSGSTLAQPSPALPPPTASPLAPSSRPLEAYEFVTQFKTLILCRNITLATFPSKYSQEVSLGKVIKV